MITVKTLKKMLSELPDETILHAYEGFEGLGITVHLPDDFKDGAPLFIYASGGYGGKEDKVECDQPEFDAMFPGWRNGA